MRRTLTGLLMAAVMVSTVVPVWAGAGADRLTVTSIRGGATDRFMPVRFRAGERAMVVAIGNGASDLDLSIYDEDGVLVAKDDDATDDCIVAWTPRWTGEFHIVVKNLGRSTNNVLRSN